MALPPEIDQLFWDEVRRYEEDKRVPFMTTPERLTRAEELRAAIELGLELKFGPAVLKLMPEINEIREIEVLRRIRDGIKTVSEVDDFRRLCTSQRRSKRKSRD